MSQQGYIGRNPGDGRTIVNRQTTHVTTGLQTSFTMTAGYEVGYLDVYLNGIKQTETLDYTASDGSTINFALSYPPVNGDVLEFVAFETLNISNIKSARRNFSVGQDLDVSGNVTIGSSLTVASDLVVNGTFTTINTEILDVEDKTVGIASTSSPSNTTADGAGIVIYGGSDGDKSITWNTDKSNFVIVGGGVSIGTGVTISTPAANVLAFSVNSAEKARFNNFGAFTVGYEGEAWKESEYVGVLQAGSGAWIGQTPAAGARAEWVNNAYYDSVNTRWEYIAADEANRIYLENGELHLQSAAAGSADGAITWNEKLAMTVGGDFKIGPNAGIGITISSSGNIDAIGIATVGIATISGNVTLGQTKFKLVDTGGYLHIQTNTGEDTAKFQKDGGTFLYFNNSQKLVTDSGGVSVTGRVAATSFTGDGSNLTGIDATQIVTGNTSVQTVDTGSDGHIKMTTEGTERLRVESGGTVDLKSGALKFSSDANKQIHYRSGDNDMIFNAASNFFYQQKIGDTSHRWYTNGADTKLMINAGGQLLVGTTSANQNNKIHARLVSSSIPNTSTASVILAENSADAWITIGSGASSYGGILFGDSGASDIGQIRYLHTDNSLSFVTNSGERLKIDSSGHLQPSADSTYDLGTASKYFRNTFSDYYYGSGEHLSKIVVAGSAYNSNLNTATTQAGVYRVNTGISNGHSGMSTYGTLFHANNVSDTGFQMYVNYNNGRAFLRGGNGTPVNGSGSMTTWAEIAQSTQHFIPQQNNVFDLGDATYRWRNIYTQDLQLSNEGKTNDVDGTWGNYTIQEGKSDLFLINNRNGKKYKFNLTEVS